ncbi:MAG: acyl-CoA dehydratase activase [Thermoplasmatota archaeon]
MTGSVDSGDLAPYDVGIDVGAISTKVLVLKEGSEIVGTRKELTSMEPGKLAEGILHQLLRDLGIDRKDIQYIISTGQGRKAVKFADMARTEITAFSKGAYHLNPESEVVVDIGGQGIRVMKMGEMGIVSDFRTNDKCSSGTGCFLDAMAVALEVGIENVGELSLKSGNPQTVSTTCTVFAESEVVSLVAKGNRKEDILAGLNKMVARKIGAIANAVGSHGPIFVAGGVAGNEGVVKELGAVLQREMIVPENPQYIGALGAAYISPRPKEIPVPEETGSRAGEDRKKGLISLLRRWRL